MAQKPISISGISESRIAPVASNIAKKQDGQSLIIVSSYLRAKRLAIDLSFFSDKKIYVMPEEDELFAKYEAKSRDVLFQKMKALKALQSKEDCIVIAPVSAAIKKMIPSEEFKKNFIRLESQKKVELKEIRKKLVLMGYENTNLVESRGEFSLRGDILDVFTPDSEHPYRIEFFDDEVDNIRCFDIDTQRSIEKLKYVEIYPALSINADKELFEKTARNIEKEYESYIKKFEKKLASEDKQDGRLRLETLKERKNELVRYVENISNLQLLESYLTYFYKEPQFLCDYLSNDHGFCIMIEDPERLHGIVELKIDEKKLDFEVLLEKGRVIPKDMEAIPTLKDYTNIYLNKNVYLFTPFAKNIKGIEEYDSLYTINSRQIPSFNGKLEILAEELRRYIKDKYEVIIVCESDEKISSIKEFLSKEELETKISLKKGILTSGMEFPDKKICYIWEGDIFAKRKKNTERKKKSKNAIKSFSDLRKGDYVVHENHGIGKFIAIEQLDVQGVKKDYLKIKYGGEDVLYVPVEQMDIVQKYIGNDCTTPKLSKLSSGEWKVTKAKAKAAIAAMAKELLELSAARKAIKGYSFGQDTVWQNDFEEMFPYMETSDQLRSISEIKKDMESDSSMDRLLCGDVGFGKTEVAARAIFKCIVEGKQAALLVPTTLLANQHYYTLKERLEKFPFKVEMLSRFRSEEQQKKIIEKLKKGEIDVIVGTHRILSEDIFFNDLGLLVIDEEQRFGVQHKERIKMMRKNVDVLTLSATPIPRTLHMSLVGVKDMSIIEEPPEERYPVQTYVTEQDEDLIKSVIERELDRDGQVYVLFNRVKGIYKISEMIERLVPEATVAVGHGQMNEHKLEQIMLNFMNKEINVLVSTTIIESGLDVPNANTIIILDADHLGLSQLYQLRGRVGRSNRIAYAYLMYQKDKVLSEIAEKRLRAIKDFTEFGAGFKVAMRDLEIRGAGNMLGTEQSGHIMNIGYELYCKLVDDAVKALKGEVVNPNKEETSIELKATANIPESYIQDEIQKLEMYKKIAQVRTEADEDDVIEEMLDRFGEAPKEVINLVKISHIRHLAEKLCISRIYEISNKGLLAGKPELPKICFEFIEKNPLKAENLMKLQQQYGSNIFIHGGKIPYIHYKQKGKKKLNEIIDILDILSNDI